MKSVSKAGASAQVGKAGAPTQVAQVKRRAIRLDRRTVLRGLGGSVVGLPVLECMLDGRARAQGTPPKRYGIVFAGQALGGDAWEKDRFQIAGVRKMEAGHFIAPADLGGGYAITTPLKPLAALKGDFSLVSGLRIPYDAVSTDPAAVPPGGAFRDFHGGGASPLLCGVRSTSATFTAEGPTSDQVIAALPEHKGKTQLESLVVRAQPSWYLSGSSYAGRQYISYSAKRKPIEAQTNPETTYNALFTSFKPASDEALARQDFERRAEASVLSLVSARRQALLGRVGTPDRVRLEAHFDQIRDLEKRIGAIGAAGSAQGSCRKPPPPGADFTIGENNAASGGDKLQTNTGYSDENRRALVFADLIAMAFICDLTRVATLQVTTFQSHMNVAKISEGLGTPILADLHEVGHNGDPMNRGQLPVSLMLQWHVSIYARLVGQLKAAPEGGATVLDNTALVFMPEAGHGRQLNDGKTENQTHSVENMILLVAGRAGGLKPGRHIAAAGAHPAQILLGAMKGAGFTGDSLGEVKGPSASLFG